MRIEELPLPHLGPGELLVEVECCTLCRSDLHSFCGNRATPLPTILGHEILGHISEMPQNAQIRDGRGEMLGVGDRVTWSIAAHCGTCIFCRRGLPQKCERLFKYGHQAIDSHHPLSGGLAEYCHLTQETTVFRLPDEIPMQVLAPANCATATAHAALSAAGDCSEKVVLIFGAGMLGLTATAMARASGAREVLVADVDPQRLQRAEQFQADAAILVADGSSRLEEVVERQTQGRGVDIVLEMSGATKAVEQAIEMLGIGGTCALVGSVFPATAARISAEKIVRNLITLRGVHNYAPENLAAAIEFLSQSWQQYPFERLVGPQFALQDTQAAFQAAADPAAFRVAVVPNRL